MSNFNNVVSLKKNVSFPQEWKRQVFRTTKAFDIVVEWNADFNADFRIENFLYKVNQY